MRSLICRGAKPGAVDNAGKTPLECAVEKGGAITDEELFIMLSETSR
jgi:Arf-GAP/coiled-coil/ANK repeat/PH domain-containing protein